MIIYKEKEDEYEEERECFDEEKWVWEICLWYDKKVRECYI